jgi:AraC-like DNA-binding protein
VKETELRTLSAPCRATGNGLANHLEGNAAANLLDLREERLRRAWRLLSDPQSPDRKIATIAYDCGFNDLSHFNRAFRRRFGETPTAARTTRVRSHH